ITTGKSCLCSFIFFKSSTPSPFGIRTSDNMISILFSNAILSASVPLEASNVRNFFRLKSEAIAPRKRSSSSTIKMVVWSGARTGHPAGNQNFSALVKQFGDLFESFVNFRKLIFVLLVDIRTRLNAIHHAVGEKQCGPDRRRQIVQKFTFVI